MPQFDPAPALRVSSQHESETRRRVDPEELRLRLVVTKGRLGVELDAPFALGPLRVEELTLSFPHVRFPVELSGGVHTFRNRRGALERIRLRLSGPDARRWARTRLAKVMAAPVAHHMIAPLEDGWLVGVATEEGVLAFEVMVSPIDGDLRLIPVNARAVGLGEPPQAQAMRVLMALVAPFGKSAGSAVVIERGPMELARALLPLAGMRAPAAREMYWSELAHDLDGAVLVAARDEPPLEVTERTVSAVELAALVAEAERCLLVGDLAQARRAYLSALTRAPRHVEIGRRLAELDHAVGERSEAALSTLSDVQPPVDAGPLGAALLQAVGDEEGARTAWQRAALAEPYGPLAACCWAELGRMTMGAAAERALDEAIARAPTLASIRWRRFEELVRRGRVAEARGDVEHLEAHAEGARERLEVLRRAADFLFAERVLGEASELYERALRYAPAHVDAIAGLAGALALLGHKRRALELLSRAAALVERRGVPAPRVTLDFARALAEVADDRPAAIAQIAHIEHLSAACFEARLFEARWRAELGDLTGASASLARLADALETVTPSLVSGAPRDDRLWSGADAPYRSLADARRALAALAEEGARIHELDRGDLPSARRLLEVAIRLGPRVASIRAAYKRVAGAAPAEPRDERRGVPAPAQPPSRRDDRVEPKPDTKRSSHPALVSEAAPPSVEEPPPEGLTSADTFEEDELEAALFEGRAELLTQRVRANPDDEDAVASLIEVLERLSRHHELLALLSARIDEAPADRRQPLVARRRALLTRMVVLAEADGRHDEAGLYRLMLEQP